MNKKMNIKQTKPLVSVIMPAYNAERFIVKAIDSVLKQTFQNFELIIIDDASKDKTPEITQRYAARYPNKIKYIRLSRNLNRGGDTAANKAILLAQGKYIARMDADDIAHPARFERQVAYLEAHSKVFLVGTNAHVINEYDAIVGEKNEPTSYQAIKDEFFTVHPLIHPSAMYRRELINGKPFQYLNKYSANNDYYTFFLLLHKGYVFANLPQKLLYYRIHNKSMTFSNLKVNFINTVKIRLAMVFRFGYEATIKDLLTLVLQSIVVLPMPNAVVTQMYLLGRGFYRMPITLPSFGKEAVAA